MPRITLLGPQQPIPSLITAVDSLGIRGRIAAITAGWEERELEDDELRAHLRGQSINLRLWERSEAIFDKDPELLAGLRVRKERIARLAEIYRMRLGHAQQAVNDLLARKGFAEDLEPEQEDAIDALLRLDAHQLARVSEVNHWFEERYRPGERDEVARHRAEIAALVDRAEAIAIAGGHVGVLITRLRLFDIASLARTKPVIAWSAGTMALCERIVLFHDSPPQGFGVVEVFESGLGLVKGIIAFPHARKRLRLEDPARVLRLVRRFLPDVCVPFDPFDRIDFDPASGRIEYSPRTRRLEHDGRVTLVGVSP